MGGYSHRRSAAGFAAAWLAAAWLAAAWLAAAWLAPATRLAAWLTASPARGAPATRAYARDSVAERPCRATGRRLFAGEARPSPPLRRAGSLDRRPRYALTHRRRPGARSWARLAASRGATAGRDAERGRGPAPTSTVGRAFGQLAGDVGADLGPAGLETAESRGRLGQGPAGGRGPGAR